MTQCRPATHLLTLLSRTGHPWVLVHNHTVTRPPALSPAAHKSRFSRDAAAHRVPVLPTPPHAATTRDKHAKEVAPTVTRPRPSDFHSRMLSPTATHPVDGESQAHESPWTVTQSRAVTPRGSSIPRPAVHTARRGFNLPPKRTNWAVYESVVIARRSLGFRAGNGPSRPVPSPERRAGAFPDWNCGERRPFFPEIATSTRDQVIPVTKSPLRCARPGRGESSLLEAGTGGVRPAPRCQPSPDPAGQRRSPRLFFRPEGTFKLKLGKPDSPCVRGSVSVPGWLERARLFVTRSPD